MRKPRRGPAWGKLGLIAAVIAAAAAAWRWTPLAEIVTADNILDFTRAVRERWWAPLVMIAAYTAGAFVMFPRPLLTLVSVVTFGVWLGLAYSTTGVLLAALVTYYTGRLMKRQTVRQVAGDRVDEASKPLKRHGVLAVFAANMMPTPPFAVQNIIAGAIRIRLWEFMLGTFLALLPAILAWTVFGDQISAALEDSANVSYWLIGGALALLGGFIYLSRRWLRAKGF
jgi:phospholipase D1/2